MARDLDNDELDRARVTAVALRLIDLGWFRVGSDRHTRNSGCDARAASRDGGLCNLTSRGVVTAVTRRVADRLGNTPAVCRQSYVAPAVVEQYLPGRTFADFRPRHLRVVGARETGLDQEELALLSLPRSWRIRQARAAV